MGPSGRSDRGQSLTHGPPYVKEAAGWHPGQKPLRKLTDRLREPRHLLGGLSGAQQAPLASQELHRLEETGAYRASRHGEAQRMYEVPRALVFLGGEAADRFLYGRSEEHTSELQSRQY